MKTIYLFAITSLLLVSCGGKKKQTEEVVPEQPTVSGLYLSKFKGMVSGKETSLYVMKNASGMEVCVTNLGARIVSVMVPDKTGAMKDVVLGFSSIDDYLNNKNNFGAAIGRYGNRIAKGKFTLEGVEYSLPINNGENSLHGGPDGFHNRYFDIQQQDDTTLVCSYVSADGEAGYPGELHVKITYTLSSDNALKIAYEAETSKSTVINLTNHSYFNLSGDPNNTILDYVLYVNADRYTPVKQDMIPTGKVESLKNTPFDFTTPTVIGARIDDKFEQLQLGGGYDHNLVLKANSTIDMLACKVSCPATGIFMEVYTDEPAVQVYSGNFLNGTMTGKNGIVYQKRSAVCLETQHYPDSPNQPKFPSTELKPGEKYVSTCIYKFGVE